MRPSCHILHLLLLLWSVGLLQGAAAIPPKILSNEIDTAHIPPKIFSNEIDTAHIPSKIFSNEIDTAQIVPELPSNNKIEAQKVHEVPINKKVEAQIVPELPSNNNVEAQKVDSSKKVEDQLVHEVPSSTKVEAQVDPEVHSNKNVEAQIAPEVPSYKKVADRIVPEVPSNKKVEAQIVPKVPSNKKAEAQIVPEVPSNKKAEGQRYYYTTEFGGLQIRLTNGYDRCSGRVEIYYNYDWGTVCDDYWDIQDAQVVCQQLGCGLAVQALPSAHFGPGSGPILLDYLQCRGYESYLWHCSHGGWYNYNCNHYEDASVICSDSPFSTTGPSETRTTPATLEPTETTTGSPCGGNLTSYSGSFTSPSYPGYYPNYAHCTWEINVPSGHYIELSFPHFDLQYCSSNCWCDSVEIYDGSYLLGRYCQNPNYWIWSSSNRMRVVFSTDGSDQRSGFQAMYYSYYRGTTVPPTTTTAPTTSSDLCGGYLTSSSGSFTSPYYPGYYPNYAHCTWEIHVPSGRYIDISFPHFDLQYCSNCMCDSVEIYDGSYLLGKYCQTPYWVYSSSNSMRVVFSTDWSDQRSGFQAVYYSYYHGTTALPATSTQPQPSPVYFQVRLVNGMDRCAGRVEIYYGSSWGTVCDDGWTLVDANVVCRELDCGSAVSAPGSAHFGHGYGPIYLDDVNCRGYEYSLWQCPHRGMGVHNCGHNEDAGVICSASASGSGSSTTNPPDRTETTTSSVSGTAMYPCGGILLQSSGSISSPFYPGNYPNNARCVWQIQTFNNYRIQLTFSSLQLETTGGCIYDYIEVYDGPLYTSPLLRRICQNSAYTFTSSANSLTVLFSSDSSVTGSGFRAFYSSIMPDYNETVALSCSADSMQAVISRPYLQSLGYSGGDLFLNNANCRPQTTSSAVIFNISHGSCGTVKEVDSNTLIYSNTIRAHPPASLITRQKKLNVVVSCRMHQNTMVEVMYVANDTIEISKLQYGRYDMSISFFDSQSFLNPVIESPYYVSLDQDLFLQTTLHSSDPDLQLFLDTCVASPDPTDFTSQTYDLIRSGCVRDSTFRRFSSPARNKSRFAFRAFKFLNSHTSVYLQCKMTVCSVNDYNSRCRQGCLSRRKRSPGPFHQEVDVIVGPIQLRK